MAMTTVLLGADKAGDLSRALALMVAGGTIAVARIYHEDDCPATTADAGMRRCTCAEVDVEVEEMS